MTSRFTRDVFSLWRAVLGVALLGLARPGEADAAPNGVTLIQAGPSVTRFAIDVAAPALTSAPSTAIQELRVPGFDLDGSPGEAALPARIILVAVPPTGGVSIDVSPSSLEWHDEVRLAPIPWIPRTVQRTPAAQPSRARSSVDREAVATAVENPPAVARLLDVSWMRDQRVARILVQPAVYDPAARRLGIRRRIEVEVRFEAGPSPVGTAAFAGRRDGFESIYRDVLVNEEQGRAWRRVAPTASGAKAAAPLGGRAIADVPTSSLFAGRKWVKISIPRTGFYRVYFGQLRNSKLFNGSNSVPIDSLRLFVWPGTPVLPEENYCDSCSYREVAIGVVDAPSPGVFDNNDSDYFYFFALGASDWTDLYAGPQDPAQPDTVFLDHPYETRNYYYLTIATDEAPVPGAPKRIVAESGALTDTVGAVTPTTFRERVHFEEDREFHPDATPVIGVNPDGSYRRRPEFWEKWFWASINNTGSSLFTEAVNLPGLEPSLPARLRLRVWGLNAMTLLQKTEGVFDHYLDVAFGDVVFPTRGWDGVLPETFDSTMTGLTEIGSVLTARVGPNSVEPDPVFRATRDDETAIAWFDVFYPRRFVPVENSLAFDSDPAGGKVVYDIQPLTLGRDSIRVFDVTDPYSPTEVLQSEFVPVAGGWRMRFERIETGRHRYRIIPDYGAGPGIVKPPNTDVVDAAGSSFDAFFTAQPGKDNLLSGHSADYLIIYYDPFAAAAESLRTWRTERLPVVGGSAPHEAMKVPVSALYDQFSGGRTDPAAIRNFLRAVFFNWSPRPTFVTLLGDASSDFKNLTGAATAGRPGALVPSYEGGFDRFVQRQYATDDWLLNVDDPLRVIPDFLGGRIPAADAAAALDYVRNKLIFYERSAPLDEWRDRVMLIADDNEQGSQPDAIYWGHMAQTVRLDLAMPPEIDRAYVYLHTYPDVGDTKPGAKADIIANLNRGVVLSNYIGHGSPFKLSDESVFLDLDADGLTNRERPTIFIAASCDVGKFNDPEIQGLGEHMLFNPNGGAVGVVSATELAFSNQNANLNLALYRKLFERDPVTGQYESTLAEGLAVAKTGATNGQKYQVMGDAALRPNLPRLWVEARVTDVDGNPVSSVQRGQTMRVAGRVLTRPGGTPVTLDGLAHLLVEDSAPIDTVPDCFDQCFGFPFRASPVFRGDLSVSGGQFATRFVMPIDAHLGARGRARATVTLGGGTVPLIDGAGSDSTAVLPGTAPASDVSGPRIVLSFVGGATRVRSNAVLRIDLFDESGILVTRNVPQNGIIVTIDDNSAQRYDVTSSFRYAANSYQAGAAFFTLPGLAPGTHHIRVSAADNMAAGITAADHRGSASIEFEVTETLSLHVTRVLLFPNPIRSGGSGGGGQFIIDAPGDSVDVLLKIYTVSGKLIRVLRSSRGLAQAQIPWDGLDAEGSPLARGAYLFKAQVFTGLDAPAGETRQRADSVGRFVVVGR